MGTLVTSGHLVPRVDAIGSVDYVLTDKGVSSVNELSQITPEDKTINLAYDGLLHRFMYVDRSLRWRPQDLKRNDLLEIPAFPADPPEIDPTFTNAIANTIRDQTSEAEQELIAVIGLDGRREKFFRKAVALVFQSVDRADDLSILFAVVDGRHSEDHSSAFARAEGRRKLGIMGILRDDNSVIPEILGQDVASQLADESEVTALRRATEGFREQLKRLELRSADASEEQKEQLASEAENIEQKIDEAEAALSRLPVRLLEVHEHPALLNDALTTAQERLLIVSPWIRAAVVDEAFIARLESLVSKAVQVTIAYGIDDGRGGSGNDQATEERLKKLAASNSQFPVRAPW